MNPVISLWEAFEAFFESGGPVLVVIFATTLLLWTLIFERILYFFLEHRRSVSEQLSVWRARPETKSWRAHQIKRMLVARVSESAHRNTRFIKTLVMITPLLGLLGTVTGMIEVFDVMAFAGDGNSRAMASGISRATIPTMAGLAAALSGVYFSKQFAKTAEAKVTQFEDKLRMEAETR